MPTPPSSKWTVRFPGIPSRARHRLIASDLYSPGPYESGMSSGLLATSSLAANITQRAPTCGGTTFGQEKKFAESSRAPTFKGNCHVTLDCHGPGLARIRQDPPENIDCFAHQWQESVPPCPPWLRGGIVCTEWQAQDGMTGAYCIWLLLSTMPTCFLSTLRVIYPVTTPCLTRMLLNRQDATASSEWRVEHQIFKPRPSFVWGAGVHGWLRRSCLHVHIHG